MKAHALILLNAFAGSFAYPQSKISTVLARQEVDPSTVSCDAQFLNDAASSSPDRWSASGADVAWRDVVALWNTEQGNVSPGAHPLNFSAFVSNHFNGPDLMVCENIKDGPCQHTVQCDHVNQPAGWLILNSLVAIHGLRYTMHEAVVESLNSMQTTVAGFQSVFAPQKTESSTWLKDLVSGINLVLGLAYAYSWNIPFKAAKIFEGNQYHGVAKDSAAAAITFGISMWRNRFTTPTSVQDDVNSIMAAVFDPWAAAEIAYVEDIFSGTTEATDTLTALLQRGMALDLTVNIHYSAYLTAIQKIVYSLLLPSIWPQAVIDDKSAHPYLVIPMILAGEGDCVTSGDQLPSIVSEADAANIAVCYDERTFYVGYATWENDVGDSDMPEDFYNPVVANLKLNPLPGGTKSEFDGTKWGGLTLDDLVISAYEGWRNNDFVNGWEIPDLGAVDGYQLMEDGVRTPGLTSIPVCSLKGLEQGAFEELSPGFTDEILPCASYVLSGAEKDIWGFFQGPTILDR
ncbi:hypothetical protein B0J13DRAFT_640329 [Dactylonectria estremocensis]|uniref:Uncharacterized protein n=1 Tax=Dactylonectria estremocensis TaxID=1079267 RepID=A0A9P9ECG2_9HYPO|nr:hypothetical protein B0J13DRAFT_640329 [Dactylonectria estremocensis]